jgi:hypothetical protein
MEWNMYEWMNEYTSDSVNSYMWSQCYKVIFNSNMIHMSTTQILKQNSISTQFCPLQ